MRSNGRNTGKKVVLTEDCPFCGSESSVEISRYSEVTGVEPELSEEDGFVVVCSFTSGGCGASSGWGFTEKEVADKWNERVSK